MRARPFPYALIALGFFSLAPNVSRPDEPAPYRLEGTVTDEAGQPVADVAVHVLVESERSTDSRIRAGKTDGTGRYSLAVPVGHATIFGLAPPPGFTSVNNFDREEFVTTRQQPVVNKDFRVRKGVAWPLLIRTDRPITKLPKLWISGWQQRDQEFFSAFIELEATDHGVLTLPDIGGPFVLTCRDREETLTAPAEMKLTFDKGFRTDKVVSVRPLDSGGSELLDDQGFKATVTGPKPEVADRKVSLAIPLESQPQSGRAAIIGRVVGPGRQPIEGARVEVVIHAGGGSSASDIITTTDAEGRFRITVAQRSRTEMISLAVTANGYAGVDTNQRKFDFSKSNQANIGDIALSTASTIPIRVVGPTGEPLEGALIEPLGTYAAIYQAGRSDKDGICRLQNLPAGTQAIIARFGTLHFQNKIPIAKGENQLLEVKLRPFVAPSASEKPAQRLTTGKAAPPWQIAEWSDGQAHKLNDYRGQVVVLDFWGVWCGPCVQMIPALKDLHKKYSDRGVVFIGIHTAGTEMSLIRRFLDQHEWAALIALDTGEDINSSITTTTYGIESFPTLMVIDRQGQVSYNSHDLPQDKTQIMQLLEQEAKAAGVPWPIDKDADENEIANRMRRINLAIYSREIDRALAAQP